MVRDVTSLVEILGNLLLTTNATAEQKARLRGARAGENAGLSSSWDTSVRPFSSTNSEAEYIDGAHAVKEAIWPRQRSAGLHRPFTLLISPRIDNQSTIAIANEDEFIPCELREGVGRWTIAHLVQRIHDDLPVHSFSFRQVHMMSTSVPSSPTE